LVGFGWFLTVMACMWWYAMRLENWTQAQGLTLLTISFVPPWNNPLGKILRINLILRTYKILSIDKMGRECVAWIRFKTLFLPTAKPTVLWEGDLHGSSSNDNERSLEQPVLPPGGLADKLAKRKEERKGELERVTAARKPQDELLF